MRWLKVNAWFAETECREYRCRKYRTGELLEEKDGMVLIGCGELRYQLYGPNGQRLGPPQDSFAACRQWLNEVMR